MKTSHKSDELKKYKKKGGGPQIWYICYRPDAILLWQRRHIVLKYHEECRMRGFISEIEKGSSIYEVISQQN
jgi:hypothetical protein